MKHDNNRWHAVYRNQTRCLLSSTASRSQNISSCASWDGETAKTVCRWLDSPNVTKPQKQFINKLTSLSQKGARGNQPGPSKKEMYVELALRTRLDEALSVGLRICNYEPSVPIGRVYFWGFNRSEEDYTNYCIFGCHGKQLSEPKVWTLLAK